MATKDDSSGLASRSLVVRNYSIKSTSVVPDFSFETVVAQEQPAAPSAPATLGPGDVPVRLNVNGRQIDLMIEPRVTLLDALRTRPRTSRIGNKLAGCEARGALSRVPAIHLPIVDGRTVYSCSTLAIEVQGKQIRSIDGLASGDRLHPVQQAFCDKDALMCGFCTPGLHHGERKVCSRSIRTRRPNRSRRGSTATSAGAARFSASLKPFHQREGGTTWLT